MLSHELLPDILFIGVMLTGQLLGGNLTSATNLLPKNGPGIPEVGDEERPLVHDSDEAARPDGGHVRLRLPHPRDDREEAFLRGQERVPDGVGRDALRPGRGLSEVGEEVVAGEAGGVGAGVAVEDADAGGGEGRRARLDAALVLEHVVPLHDGDGQLPGVAPREVPPPQQAIPALSSGLVRRGRRRRRRRRPRGRRR